jgi:tripartite-type tricarboxylate transporter receptor subunit TctC
MVRIRSCLMAVVAAGTIASSVSATAQSAYPAQLIKIVVALPAGGFADAVARVISEPLGPMLGQSIVVENRGGAGGNIGARAVAQAAPDGYTVLVTTTAIAINDKLYTSKGYATSDLVPVAIVGSAPEVFAVHPENPARTMAQLIRPADGKPVQFGTAGVGTGSHIAGEYLFKILAKVPAEHVAFSGGAPAIQNILGNHLNSIVGTLPAVAEHIREGAMRGLGVASAKRSPTIPDVPTIVEAGYPDFYASSWVGFFVPSATDAAIVKKLNAGINQVLDQPVSRQRLEKSGLEIMVNDPAQTAKFFQDEVERWGTRVQALGLAIN